MDTQDLYSHDDPVIVLDDGSFIGKQCKIRKQFFQSHGFIKAYAPWCGHCQAKVNCMKKLSSILKEYGVSVYVINADNNPMFAEHFRDRVTAFPTFLSVNDKGVIGTPLLDKKGEQVYTIPGIISSLCGNNSQICKIKGLNDCP